MRSCSRGNRTASSRGWQVPIGTQILTCDSYDREICEKEFRFAAKLWHWTSRPEGAKKGAPMKTKILSQPHPELFEFTRPASTPEPELSPDISRVSTTGRCSADFSRFGIGISRISNPQMLRGRCSLPTGSRRYSRLETCATQPREPGTALSLRNIRARCF